MNRQQLRDRLRALTGVRMTSLMPDAEANDYLNEAVREVGTLADWSYLYATGTVSATVGVATYTLPASIVRVEDVTFASGANRGALRFRSRTDLARYPDHLSAQGTPWGFALEGDSQITLFPTPDASYTVRVRGYKQPTVMSSDTATPEFEAAYHPVAAYVAAVYVLEAQGDDSGRADDYIATAASYLERMALRYLDDPAQLQLAVLAGRMLRTPDEERP